MKHEWYSWLRIVKIKPFVSRHPVLVFQHFAYRTMVTRPQNWGNHSTSRQTHSTIDSKSSFFAFRSPQTHQQQTFACRFFITSTSKSASPFEINVQSFSLTPTIHSLSKGTIHPSLFHHVHWWISVKIIEPKSWLSTVKFWPSILDSTSSIDFQYLPSSLAKSMLVHP